MDMATIELPEKHVIMLTIDNEIIMDKNYLSLHAARLAEPHCLFIIHSIIRHIFTMSMKPFTTKRTFNHREALHFRHHYSTGQMHESHSCEETTLFFLFQGSGISGVSSPPAQINIVRGHHHGLWLLQKQWHRGHNRNYQPT
jgi:hypothetical protein